MIYSGMIMKTYIAENEKGFALVAALMACLILVAIGILVITMSTGDLFTSRESVGHKKAMAAVESGVSKIMKDVGPDNWTTANLYTAVTDGAGKVCGTDDFDEDLYSWMNIPGAADNRTEYAVCTPRESTDKAPVQAVGFSLAGGGSSAMSYGYQRYDTTVVGKNESYNSQAKVNIGVGFGPVPIGEN